MNVLSKNNLFYTTNTILEWQNVLLHPDVLKIIYNTWHFLSENGKVKIYAFVIMPNHIHWIYEVLPPYTNAQVKHSFSGFTSKEIFKATPEIKDYFFVDKSNRKYQLWKSPSLSVPLYSQNFLMQKLHYIHLNPKRAGILDANGKYLHTSLHSYQNGKPEWPFLTLL